MYFTLAVSAATAAGCAALVRAACDADPRIMPVPGPARTAWRAPDGRAVVLHWGAPDPAAGHPDGARPDDRVAASHAGTIWAASMFGIVRRRAAERSLNSPQADTHAVWALATLAALLSGDWLNAPG